MAGKSAPMNALRFVRWPLAIAFGGAVFLLVGVSTARETYQVWQVDQEIKGLQSQVDQFEGKKLQLVDMMQKLSSMDELDKQARERLGLRKPGERVVILRDGSGNPLAFDPSVTQAAAPQETTAAVSNPTKWLRYFFIHS